ncbi:MAG: cysteine protease, partial [Bacteroidales bacterium]|nr:cysteine protease [Bacteroidales bacterium]
ERVSLVQDFDMLCDDVVSLAINIAQNYDVIEEEVLVPKKVFTLVSK